MLHGAFNSWQDQYAGLGKRPLVFDILGPDRATSILPPGLKLVLHANPKSLRFQYNRQVERIQTQGGFVEQHWGDALNDISAEAVSGGFMRLYSGLSSTTNPAYGGTRRDTLAYDSYLDLHALYRNNGSVVDSRGNIVLQGIVKLTFDGGVYLGWFNSFTPSESSEQNYQFNLSFAFQVDREITTWRTSVGGGP